MLCLLVVEMTRMTILGPTDCLMQDSNNFGTNVTAGTSSSRHEKTGPVVGGLIGALLLLGITFAALWISKKRRRVSRRVVLADKNNTPVQSFHPQQYGHSPSPTVRSSLIRSS